MTLTDLQQRLAEIATGFGREIPHDAFRILAADHTEGGINLTTEDGQAALERLLDDVDLMILDNLSTLFPSGSESAGDAWEPMQTWLLKLRRAGKAVLFVHHAGTNGRQRGTSRREDVLDTVIALRRPEDYSPEQGALFEVHFEKLRHRADGAMAFEASAKSAKLSTGVHALQWTHRDLVPPMLARAVALFQSDHTVREVAAILRVSRSKAGRLRQRAVEEEKHGVSGDNGARNNLALSRRPIA
jgi:putative DNA primase/helicase